MECNPITELGYIAEDMSHIESMGKLLTDAIYCGEHTTLQMAGESLEIMLEQFHERLDLLEILTEEISRCFAWVYGMAAVSDKYYWQEYGRYISCNGKGAVQNREMKAVLRNAEQYTCLLPKSTQGKICILINEAGAASRKQGFAEGYKAAVARCSMNGGGTGE